MYKQLKQKIDLKTKPPGSLGRLEKLALQIGKIQNTLTPALNKPCLLVFAADHGLTDEGVSAFPKEVTYQMVMNFIKGGAAINVFCKQNNIRLKVIDAGVDHDFPKHLDIIHAKIAYGSKNIIKEPAMPLNTCKHAINKGREIVTIEANNGCNIIGFGEMGIGNTSAAALLMHKFTGIVIEECVGQGTGHSTEGFNNKLSVLKRASDKHTVSSAIDILSAYGGIEIAMICGGMLEAYVRDMLIMVDGFISTIAFLAAFKMNPNILEHAIFCHVSHEKGHQKILDYLKAKPLIKLDMRLGEGTGIAVAYPIIQSAVCFLNQMASFKDAGISNKQTQLHQLIE